MPHLPDSGIRGIVVDAGTDSGDMKDLSPNHQMPMHFQPAWCRVTFLNPAAESPTGWTQNEAAGFSLERVFNIVNRDSRKTVESPSARALCDGAIGLANHTLRWSG